MEKVIIGIHGLANKSPRETLEKWWKDSIAEGLSRNMDNKTDFNFKLVYWAKYLYKYPLHEDKSYSFDDLYNKEPYVPASKDELKEYYDGFLDDVSAWGRGLAGNAVDYLKKRFDINWIADWALGKCLKDLAFYYSDSQYLKADNGKHVLARQLLQDILKQELLSCAGKEIMVIAHSMGTIIAYDVLRQLGQEKPDFQISYFITIGSPLGLPHVRDKIRRISSDGKVRTPSVIKKAWLNFADSKDLVAADVRLEDDYGPNNNEVKVFDDLVYNSYHIGSSSNHHKSYGYLRTPEISRCIDGFLK
ncbi:MAG: alpha/beta hydrolase [Victivallaceae bacterium]|nr:alpha/beta hydrolase [Victivallaceae bacterium]